ncbi:hypothetical protein SAMN05444007_101434 [Cribrihabitans marinus]|uniref:PH domain-containing protein n=1 Tax=Cribrihabitans marinus TaxID=1227549 RepID=A0A1H6RF72_9RHOB|nr:hypothetical protein [Cribrihabitans marinus]GGH20659.1 hypothetical protein GCM10010973_04760 [Cribrihabitans marinus]SEI51944.1 hypothetical protein SAMN05444007_101434 [Cribrihabitans marinus]
MEDEVLAVVSASAPRRWIGIGMLAGVALIVLYVAIAEPPQPGWQLFLVVMGAAALWVARRMAQATTHRIELTRAGLRSSTGEWIARLEEIAAMDRGMFAFKPSNGFLVRLKNPGSRAWQPGLWWRLGRRVGIGGVTPASQTKAMADILAALLAERDQMSDAI